MPDEKGNLTQSEINLARQAGVNIVEMDHEEKEELGKNLICAIQLHGDNDTKIIEYLRRCYEEEDTSSILNLFDPSPGSPN